MPLYTVSDAARIVDVPVSTLVTWAKGGIQHHPGRRDVVGDPIITVLGPGRRMEPSIPFIGLAEAMVLAAVRRSGAPMQRIRPALDQLRSSIGVEHALASHRLLRDGPDLLLDYAESRPDTSEGGVVRDLVVVRGGRPVFAEVIEEYLSRIEYAADGYAALIHVPTYGDAQVVVDPTRSFGAPIFERGGARVDDVLERFWSGESIEELAGEFGVPEDQLEDVLRVASRRAA